MPPSRPRIRTWVAFPPLTFRLALLLVASCAVVIGARPTWAQLYTITDLGDFGGLYSYAYAVNDSGQVVGMSYLPDGDGYTVSRAFLWENGELKNLGTLGGESSEAFGINNDGVIVGGSHDPAGYYHAFRYAGGAMSDLGIMSDYSRADAINDDGRIVGGYYVGTSLHAFVVDGGGLVDLGTFGGTISNAADVNENGDVVGVAHVASERSFENQRAFLYSGGAMINLGTLDGNYDSAAGAVNDSGLVVGQAYQFYAWGLYTRAVVWGDGQISSLVPLEGSFHSSASGVNNKGDIVGSIANTAVLWKDGQTYDLNAMLPEGSGWRLSEALDINESGQIVGSGSKDGRTRAFLMTPGKYISIRDAKGDSLPDVPVSLFRVQDDAPRFTETFVGSFRTDEKGQLEIPLDALALGDSVRVALHVKRKPSLKHGMLLPAEYDIVLDNAAFDSTGQAMSYDRLDSTSLQTITLDHTEIVIDLLISIEWDAEQPYLENIETSFHRMANYLYDVYDGQLRIDTVLIFDDRRHWAAADFKIFASNTQWPMVDIVYGARLGKGSVLMPRKWFGDSDPTRNGTFSEVPLNLAHTLNYRTKAHELGHYWTGFHDEYQFLNAATNSWDQSSRCALLGRVYGFMDAQYDTQSNFPYDSELSNVDAYLQPSCQNNAQFVENKKSTYEQFEADFERVYTVGATTVYVPITRPEERADITRPYLLGPNEDEPVALTFDVGARVAFPNAPAAPSASTAVIAVKNRSTGAPLPKVDVVAFTPATQYTTVQGETADNGMLRALGVKVGDEITSSAGVVTTSAGKRGRVVAHAEWLYGRAVYGGEASLEVSLTAVAGDYPLIISAEAGAEAATYRLESAQVFSSNPEVEFRPSDGGLDRYALEGTASSYVANIPHPIDGSGAFVLEAEDDSSAAFFVPTGYTAYEFSPESSSISVKGANGASDIRLDSLSVPVARAITLSSPYPVIRTGLDTLALQAGQTHSISVHPAPASIAARSSVIIRYADSDLGGPDQARELESTLRIHRWDPAEATWKIVGGSVDTLHNEVSAALSGLGVYGAFTTKADGTSIGEHETVPQRFELVQNYPNPFNPSTSIEYTIASRQHVKLEVFDVLGRRVATLVDAEVPAGSYHVRWDAGGFPTGVYAYRLQAGAFVAVKMMTLVR